MTKYIDQLSENEEILLLQKLEYSPFNDGFRRDDSTQRCN